MLPLTVGLQVDAIVTDPPYGLEFMGKDWDRLSDDPNIGRMRKVGMDVMSGRLDQRSQNEGGTWFGSRNATAPNYYRGTNAKCRGCGKWRVSGRHDGQGNTLGCQCEHPDFRNVKGEAAGAMQSWHDQWACEAFRILKPGGHILAFGGSRTYHRMACAVEDAGFEIRDQILWLYGSGFPKSRNLKDVREGWGTALKPAHEPIILARKPLSEPTVAANVLTHGVGGINVDGCRIGTEPTTRTIQGGGTNGDQWRTGNGVGLTGSPAGRWPANVCLSHNDDCEQVGTKRVKGSHPVQPGGGQLSDPYRHDNSVYGKFSQHAPHDYTSPDGTETVGAWRCSEGCAVSLLDQQSGNVASHNATGSFRTGISSGYSGPWGATGRTQAYGDTGGASRFFYTAKASASERNAGLSGMPATKLSSDGYGSIQTPKLDRATPRENWTPHVSVNDHPTVKPIALMRWLCRLITPPGGTVLDCFMGSGTTGCAAVLEGFNFIGVEQDAHYIDLARRRIAYWEAQGRQVDMFAELPA